MTTTSTPVRPYRMAIGTVRALRKCLKTIRHADAIKHYEWRNAAVYHALAIAASLDMPCGIEIDPEEPQWPARRSSPYAFGFRLSFAMREFEIIIARRVLSFYLHPHRYWWQKGVKT
jgi:hypothetical protein